MSTPKHVVVIGAGIVGLSTADALVKRGFRVTVLEKDPGPGEGCSCGNGGMIVPSHFIPLAAPGMVATGMRMLLKRGSPFGITGLLNLETIGWLWRFARSSNAKNVERSAPVLRDLGLASRKIYDNFASDFGADIGFAGRGLLMLCQSRAAMDEEAHIAEQATSLGIAGQILNSSELAALEPGLTMDAIGAVYFKDDAHLTPGPVIRALRARILAGGGVIRDSATITGFRSSGTQIASVVMDGEELEGDEFVLAAGSWSGQLAAKLDLRLLLLAGKGYGFTVANPPQQPTIPAILTGARVAMTPMLDGVRFVGTMEIGRPDLRQNQARIEGMKANIPRFYPAFSGAALDAPVWAGLRPCSPDGMPYIGRSRQVPNLVIGTGHAMVGMSLGPISGQLIAELVAGEKPSIEIGLLSPDRFG